MFYNQNISAAGHSLIAQQLQERGGGVSFYRKCAKGGGYNQIIWFYELSW